MHSFSSLFYVCILVSYFLTPGESNPGHTAYAGCIRQGFPYLCSVLQSSYSYLLPSLTSPPRRPNRLLLCQLPFPLGKLPQLCYMARHKSCPACPIAGNTASASASSASRPSPTFAVQKPSTDPDPTASDPILSEPFKTRVPSRSAALSNQPPRFVPAAVSPSHLNPVIFNKPFNGGSC